MCGKHAADKEYEWAIGTDGDVWYISVILTPPCVTEVTG